MRVLVVCFIASFVLIAAGMYLPVSPTPLLALIAIFCSGLKFISF